MLLTKNCLQVFSNLFTSIFPINLILLKIRSIVKKSVISCGDGKRSNPQDVECKILLHFSLI